MMRMRRKMSKALLSTYKQTFVDVVNNRFGITSNYTDKIFTDWVDMGFHLIFDEGTSETTVANKISSLLDRIILPYYKFFNAENVDVVEIEASGVDVRTTEVKINNASEAQPINADITDLTSPSSKTARIGGGTDTNRHTTISDTIKYIDLLREVKSFGYQIKQALSPIIEELSEMY